MKTYEEWKQYIENGGDLRALDVKTAEMLEQIALERGDEAVYLAVDLFMGA